MQSAWVDASCTADDAPQADPQGRANTDVESEIRPSVDRGWAVAVRGWALFSAAAFATATVLYLVEATGALGVAPTYTSTEAGSIRDEATYWVAAFAYRHATLWNYILRDGLFFFAFLGFIPLLLAANAATGGRRASVQLAPAFMAVGAIFGALNAVAFLVDVWWWRSTGWAQTAPEIMIAVGRSTEVMSDLSFWFGAAANTALAVGLAYLAAACWTERALPRRIGWVALVTALLQPMIVGAALMGGMEVVHSVLSLVTGVVLAPLILIGLGLRLANNIASAVSPPSPSLPPIR